MRAILWGFKSPSEHIKESMESQADLKAMHGVDLEATQKEEQPKHTPDRKGCEDCPEEERCIKICV